MCCLKAAQIHDPPFRAAKDHVQPLAALDSFLPNGKKILICHHLSFLGLGNTLCADHLSRRNPGTRLGSKKFVIFFLKAKN